MRDPVETASGLSPAKQLAGFIDKYDAQARTPLPSSGRGRTIIKSISAKQRPRRKVEKPKSGKD